MKLPKLFLLILLFSACTKKEISTREIDFNKNWVFIQNNNLELKQIHHKKLKWDSIKVPHDWTAKTPYNQAYKVTDSTPPLGGIGWYKKQFTLKEEDKNKQISIEFDGIYNNSKVWINNHYLGFWPYGYTAFSYDLTPYLKFGKENNEILIRVDRTNFLDARWYSGAGIYRDVKLITKNKVHIPKWGIKIETPEVSISEAKVFIDLQTINATSKEASLKIVHSILNKQNIISSQETSFLQKDSIQKNRTFLNINEPKLWSPSHPNLYQLNTKVYSNNSLVDETTTTFGVRSLQFDAKKGFFINQEKTYIKGVCLHHAAGALGAAVPNNVWINRLKKLKEGGVNAIRTAHNPASEAFLNICDSLGFLVQEEIFDELDYPKDKRKNYNNDTKEQKYVDGYTNYFQKHWEKDLESMLQRDKNHPSIFMWSIGNEIEWTYPRYYRSRKHTDPSKNYYYDEPSASIELMKERFANDPPKKYELAKTVLKLSRFAKSIDTTRPITANLVIPVVGHFSGYTDALDVVGYSYRACLYDYGHRNYPEKMIYGSENWANYVEWKSVLENPHIPGVFLWTGIHYMGETRNIESRGSTSGLLHYSGRPTPRWYMFKSIWNKKPMIYATTYPIINSDYKIKNGKVVYKEKDHWKKRLWGWQQYNYHWNYKKGQMIVIEVFTNCPKAKLLLNGSEKGIEKLSDYEDNLIKFAIPFEAGELKVIGNCDEKDISYSIKTSDKVSGITLSTNQKKNEVNSEETISIKAQLVDKNETPITNIDEQIEFEISNDFQFLGIENDAPKITNTSGTPSIKTFKGEVLLYLKAGDAKGDKEITAKLKNGIKKTIHIKIK